MKPVRFLRPAELEMLDAAQYYELQAPGLGIDFLDKIDSAIQDIGMNPERWPVAHFNIRRRLIHRFPYAMLYLIDDKEIVIQAVMHLRRRPGYWIDRK
jgi:plasmid stabilization system protein ParE